MSIRKNISVVLVGPKQSGNVGSVARAMVNVNMKNLLIVSPRCEYLDNEAIKMSMDGREVLNNALIYDTLKEAIKDHHLVIGTTRRKRKRIYPTWTPREITKKIDTYKHGTKIALVFGREDMGLSNQELALCQLYGTIPASEDFQSFNLAQAVLIFIYELFINSERKTDFQQKMPAKREQVHRMYDQLKDILVQIEFINRGNADHMMQSIQNIFNRTELTQREVRIFRGICATMKYVANKNK